MEEVADSIIWSVSNWVSRDKKFEEVYVREFNRSWQVFFQKSWFENSVRSSSWKSPPQGVLKLNLMEVFFEERRGGHRGVISNSCDNILCSLSGPTECDDANRAEVFDMFLGCRELRKLEAANAFVEGDSLSAIRWGLSMSKCPWRLEDWVEDVHFISTKLNFSFNHILRKVNAIADFFNQGRSFNLTVLFFLYIWVSCFPPMLFLLPPFPF